MMDGAGIQVIDIIGADADAIRNHDPPDVDDDDDGSSSGISDESSESELDAGQMLEQLANNDPDLTSLCMNSVASFDSAADWRRVGMDIGRNTNLELLSFHHMDNANVTRQNYEALFEGLVRNTSVRDVDFLQSNLLGGWIFPQLAPILEQCSQITIEDCDLGLEGSLLLSGVLNMCRKSSLEEINLDQVEFGDQAIVHVIEALKRHTQLEKISLRGSNIGTSVCHSLLHLLPNRTNNARLITLDLGENEITDEGVSILTSGLNDESSTTTHLNLSSNPIGTLGWLALSDLLGSSRSRLKSLSMNNNFIPDDASIALARSLVNNGTLTDLYLDNTGFATRGLQAFSDVLRSPASGLRNLSLRKNRVKNLGAILLADCLRYNNTMRSLNLENDISITTKGWKAFSRLLCRRSSIMDTYSSNHTLQKLIGDEYTLSGDLMLLLLMNRDGDERHVARQKIIKCHFTGRNLNTQPFVDMEIGALPHVISWMGRDGFALLYQFLKDMQSLFDFNEGVKADNGPAPNTEKVHLQSVAHCPESFLGEWWHESACDLKRTRFKC